MDTALPLPLERPGACSKDPSLCFTPFPSLLSVSLLSSLRSPSLSLSPLQLKAQRVGTQDIKQAEGQPSSFCLLGASLLSDLSSLSLRPPSSYQARVNAGIPLVRLHREDKDALLCILHFPQLIPSFPTPYFGISKLA